MTPGTVPGTPRVLRAMNDRAALDLLLEHGPLSRTRIGTLTGLSKPTASQLLARLEAAGLVIATGTSEGRPGPNAQLYAVNPATAHVAALDVAPDRILAEVADITGRTAGAYELGTAGRRADGAVRHVVDALDGAVKAAGLTRADLHRVVIGTPGAFDPGTGRLRYASHLPGWHSPTLLDDLAAALPMPLEYDNDVNLAAVAEHRLGAARGHDDFVLLWNEAGIGAAIVIGGRLHRGWTGGAGEVGFLPVPGTPLVRQVGKADSGGFQELAGARAVRVIARDLGLPVPEGPDREVAAHLLARAANDVARSGEHPEPAAGSTAVADGTARADWAHVAAGGNGAAGTHGAAGPYGADDQARLSAGAQRDLLRHVATGLATGLASMVAVLDPGLLVLSGGVIAAGGEPLRALVQAELAELAVPRPGLVLGTVRERPVLQGALESALATTRDEVFDTSR
ncbi:ROK family transcriptional regulator [Streptomyces sp. NPDC051776]|uniref:ROK family transcriptional regulator n=1 Tax=Streptomyces sp. NPDC051776 TaxID=3155414 RepID=UPI00343E26C0